MTDLRYYCDAAIDAHRRASAAAVVIRDAAGQVVDTACRILPAMTNNEAEYEALILGLECALTRGDRGVVFLVDSQIVVGQIAGCFAVRDHKLAPRHRRAMQALAYLPDATLMHVPREQNLVADAMARESLQISLARGCR
jgi:ribonuclease HI